MAYPGQTAASNSIKQQTVSSAIEDFDPAISRVGTFAERLQKLHDRVHGSRPEPASNGKSEPIQQSLISSINERRSRLQSMLDDMESVISGLENGI